MFATLRCLILLAVLNALHIVIHTTESWQEASAAACFQSLSGVWLLVLSCFQIVRVVLGLLGCFACTLGALEKR